MPASMCVRCSASPSPPTVRKNNCASASPRPPPIPIRPCTPPLRFPKPNGSCSRTRISAFTAVFAPNAARPPPGTCRNSNFKFHTQEGPYLPQQLMPDAVHVATRVNDFALKLANVNGTGSASANGLLMQAIFRMGIPVSGKNLFPSNIQGLPTWYEIRVNKDGHTARALDYDLMVAMNAQTYARDIAEVRPGGYVLYDSSWPLDRLLYREDVTF